MQKGLTLKYDTLENWSDFLEENSYSPTCQVVCKNGKEKMNTIILAAISPFLKDLLSSLPPYIEGCIILPDIQWTDFSQFLESLSKSNEQFTVAKSLVTLLGINLNHFNVATIKNVAKEELVGSLEEEIFEYMLDNSSDEEPNFVTQENLIDKTNLNKTTHFKDEKEMFFENSDVLINNIKGEKRPADNLSEFQEIGKKMRVGNASVHQEFEEKKGNYGKYISKCKHCEKIYNHRNSSGLMIHLKRKHHRIYQQCQEQDTKIRDDKFKLRMVQFQIEKDDLNSEHVAKIEPFKSSITDPNNDNYSDEEPIFVVQENIIGETNINKMTYFTDDKEIFSADSGVFINESTNKKKPADKLSEIQEIAKKMRVVNPSVHQEFEEIQGNYGKSTSKCKHCEKIYNHRNSSGLMIHLKKKHSTIYQQCKDEDTKKRDIKFKLMMVQLQIEKDELNIGLALP